MSSTLGLKRWAERVAANSERVAHHRFAPATIASIELAACTLIPLPVALIMVALITAAPQRWLRFALSAFIGSMIGGILLYTVGVAFFSAIGERLIQYYDAGEMWARMAVWADGPWGFAFVALACVSTGFFRVACLGAGLAGLNPAAFIAILALSRGARWVAECGAIRLVGDRVRRRPSQYFKYAGLGAAAILLITLVVFALT